MLINPFTGLAFNQDIEVIGRDQIKYFLQFEDLIKRMGLGLICMHCTRVLGPPRDGVTGRIDRDGSYHVVCAHRDRVFKVNPNAIPKQEDRKVRLYNI